MPICQQAAKNRKDHNHLAAYARTVTSQCGEDGILERIFQLIPDVQKFCVEFGAWDGKALSNIWNLTKNQGWNSLFIEANPERFKELLMNHHDNPKAICFNRLVEFEGIHSLDNMLQKVRFPVDFDLISIDVDGNDWHIWDSLKSYHPKVVLVEFNPTIPNDVIYVQDRDLSVNQGNSLLAFIQLGKHKGYELIATTPWNAFFVKKEYYPLFQIEDNAIDYMYDDSVYGTKIFQLFDGTLTLAGVKKLLWHGRDFTDEEIQVLPISARRFPDHISK